MNAEEREMQQQTRQPGPQKIKFVHADRAGLGELQAFRVHQGDG